MSVSSRPPLTYVVSGFSRTSRHQSSSRACQAESSRNSSERRLEGFRRCEEITSTQRPRRPAPPDFRIWASSRSEVGLRPALAAALAEYDWTESRALLMHGLRPSPLAMRAHNNPDRRGCEGVPSAATFFRPADQRIAERDAGATARLKPCAPFVHAARSG